MTPADWLLHTHAFATLAMTGLIWFVQIVHYPLMAEVGAPAFARYEAAHVSRTTVVVAPLMLVELITCVWLALDPPAGHSIGTWLGLGLVAVAWLSTALVQVPCHRRLEHGFDAATVRRLVASNWLRTFAWTARAPIALSLLTALS